MLPSYATFEYVASSVYIPTPLMVNHSEQEVEKRSSIFPAQGL